MKLRSIISIGLIVVVGTHQALAQEGKSRAQVRAELDEAIHKGDILAPGELGIPLNQLRPNSYPRVSQAPGKSREQVKSELMDAIRTGDIIAGEASFNLNEAHPNLYPPVAMLPGKTREEVKSELAEAVRTGDILAGGELSLRLNELYPWQYRSRALAGSPIRTGQRGTISLSY